MKVALFARYSSKLQDEMSLEAQLHEMQAFCRRQNWQVVQTYLLPETRSSELERSDEWQQMMSDAKAKRFECLLVHKLDRLGRDRELAVLTKASLRRRGIQVTSVVEHLSDSANDRMMEGMMELFSEHYSLNLAEETRKGQRQLVRNGSWQGGKVPFGYDVVKEPVGKTVHTRLVVHKVDGPIMAEIFARFADGERPTVIMDWFERLSGDRWTTGTLLTRIKNPIYKGVVVYGKTSYNPARGRRPGKAELVEAKLEEAIVSEEVWEAANAAALSRANVRGINGRLPQHPYPLSGLMTCAVCEAPITGSRSAGASYYRCTNHRSGCAGSIRSEDLELAVLDGMRELFLELDRKQFLVDYKEYLRGQKTGVKIEAQLRKELTDVRARERRLLAALESGAVELDQVGERLKELKAQAGELAQQIAVAQPEREAIDSITAEQVGRFLDEVSRLLENQILHEKTADFEMLTRHFFRSEINLKERAGRLWLYVTEIDPEIERGPLAFEARRPRKPMSRSARI